MKTKRTGSGKVHVNIPRYRDKDLSTKQSSGKTRHHRGSVNLAGRGENLKKMPTIHQ